MKISENRLNSPYNPVKDFLNGKNIIVLGDIAYDSDLQAEIINSNLNGSEPTVCSLEDPQWINHRYSKMEICKIIVRKIPEDKRNLTVVIATLAMSIISITFWVLSARSFANFYHHYKNGGLVTRVYRGIYSPARSMVLGDVVEKGLDLLLANAIPTVALVLHLIASGRSIKKKIDSLNQRKVATRKITSLPSSGASHTIAVKDLFTDKQLSISEARRPRKLTIGNDTGDVWKMINRVLSMEKVYAYPSENKTMTFQEAQKLNTDIHNLLAIKDFSFYSHEFPKDRKEAFLKLLPVSTIQKYDLNSIFG